MLAAADLRAQRLAEKSPAEEGVYLIADVMPEFPGGKEAILSYFREHMQADALNSTTGKVVISFLVTETGKVKDVKVIRGSVPTLNETVRRAAEKMPDWKPGTVARQAVKVRMQYPVVIDGR